jgi:hypothetical protein
MDAASRSSQKPELIDRRDAMRRGLRAAYVVPAILAVVKATERPAYAQVSGGLPDESLFPNQPPTYPAPPNGGPFDPTAPLPFDPAPPGDETITHIAPLPDGVRAPYQSDSLRPPSPLEMLRQRPPSQ